MSRVVEHQLEIVISEITISKIGDSGVRPGDHGRRVVDVRGIEEKASRFSAGMNPTLPYTVHRSMAQLDIPR